MRFLIGDVGSDSAFVSDLDILAAPASLGEGGVRFAGRGRHEKRGAACAVPLGLPWLRGLPWPRSLVISVPLLGWVRVLRCLWCVVRIRWSSSELVSVVYAQRASRRLMPV